MRATSPIEKSSMLRVLHVFGELRPSGAEVMMRVAAPYFVTENVTCDILSTGANGVGSYAPVLKDAGYVIHHLPFSRTIEFFRKFRRLVKAGQYDIVHIHMEKASAWLALSVVPLVKTVRTIHNNFTFSNWLGTRRRWTRLLSRVLGVRHLAISPSVQATEQDHFGNPTTLCLNWYDSGRFQPPAGRERDEARQQFGLAAEQVAIISVGNCNDVKNHAAIVRALAQEPALSKVVYLHAGQEDDAKSESALARRLGVDDRIRFLGSVADVRSLLYAADLLVMPSLREGFAIAALEALGCAVPLLVADTPGLRDLRLWFSDIALCKPTASGVRQGLDAFVRLPAHKRTKHAADNSARARAMFGVKEGVKRYADVYRDLVPRAPSANAAAFG